MKSFIVFLFFIFSVSLSVFLESCSCSNEVNVKNDTTQPSALASLLKSEWTAPDTLEIGNDDEGQMIHYGRELINHTSVYLGPHGTVSKMSNGMNCKNCHLDGGTRLWANTFSAVYSCYPKFRPRSGTVEHLEKRINDCFERSLNGSKLDSLSKEMRAMVAYINWVGKDVKKDSVPEGAAVVDLPYLNRPADPAMGKLAFEKHCVTCHGADGQGKLSDDGRSYTYPPLWGDKSFNVSAGMYRVSRLAGFIKSNMPDLKSTYDKPTLTNEEAWDIAAFVNSMPRPDKRFANDWPDISKKPIDFPFGPYKDHFSEKQHKYGPFGEIKKLTAKK